ncbi:unnamed protein product [Prorocentrum cordatum]|uniref:Uncharacterized protein n=1 Tax=Prorocentrum cordatum TaxID=2364126 RepID=A0ABN9P672_9DINO|nr:unnamed protein product [Polarella glacialis]
MLDNSGNESFESFEETEGDETSSIQPLDSSTMEVFGARENSRVTIVRTSNANSRDSYVIEDYTDLQNDDLIHVVSSMDMNVDPWQLKLRAWMREGHWTMQCIALWASAFLTHSYAYQGPKVGGNLAQATVVCLCGLAMPEYAAPCAVGAYTGIVSELLAPEMSWFAFLCLVTCIVWRLVSHFKIFVGLGGRLGFTAFCSCHFVQIAVLMPLGVVENSDHNMLVKIIFFGRQETWSYEYCRWDVHLISLGFCVLGAVNSRFLRQLGNALENPVVGATSGSLLCFVIFSVSSWSSADVAMNGYAVGSFVGMASFEMFPSSLSFALGGLLAGGFIPLLEPLYTGWSGKQGFCALMGCSTFLVMRRLLSKCTKLQTDT